jgi:hypothetical protein
MAQCTATSKRTHERCKRGSIPGGTVCKHHGGYAPQVRAKAAERLAALVDPAITRLSKLVGDENGTVGLGAVKDVLDRNGFKPSDKVELAGAGGGPLQIIVNFPDHA